MIALKFELKERGLTGKRLKTEMREIKRVGYQKLGEAFHEDFLPKRFTLDGGRMLNYGQRSIRYFNQKRRSKGHTDPLVWSGESKRLALNIRDVRVKVTEKTSEVRVMIHARGLNRTNPRSNFRMSDEVRRVAPQEQAPLVAILDRAISDEFKARGRIQ